MMTVHIVSETEWVTQGQGVHTAFVESVQLLSEEKDLKIVVNNEGLGDIFHSHTYGPYFFWKGLRYKGRRILTAHVIPDSSKGTIPYWKQLMPFTKIYLKLAFSYADTVIAISPTVEQAIRKLGVNSKIVLIPNPVLAENWMYTRANRVKGRAKLNIETDEKVVIGVGQLQQRKGVEDFIDIAAAMPEYKFVWVGGRPWGKFTEGVKRIDERIANAPANLQFTGLLELCEMPVMYAAADVFLFPSYQENCPLAPLEAAAAGLPVVFRDLQEYKPLYKHPYLNASDTEAFIRITKELLTNEDYYHKGIMMSNQLIKGFDKISIRDDLMNLYKQTFDGFLKSLPEDLKKSRRYDVA